MMELYGYLSTALYAAGAGLFIAAAVVLKRNRLIEYRRLMKARGISDTEKTARKLMRAGVAQAVKKEAGPAKGQGPGTARQADVKDDADGTTVQDGRADTTVLKRSDRKKAEQTATPGRTWAKPSRTFRVITSDMVTHDNEEGEQNDAKEQD